MSASKVRIASLVTALLPLCACQPPDVLTSLDGPQVVLTPEANDAQFSVQFCYDGPNLDEAYFQGRVFGEVRGAGAEQGLELVVELPGVEPPAEDPDTHRSRILIGGEDGIWLNFPMEESFNGRSSACSDEYLLSFMIDGELQNEQEITVDWSAEFGGRYSGPRRNGPHHDDLNIRIEAL
jgi:hypothetical protein